MFMSFYVGCDPIKFFYAHEEISKEGDSFQTWNEKTEVSSKQQGYFGNFKEPAYQNDKFFVTVQCGDKTFIEEYTDIEHFEKHSYKYQSRVINNSVNATLNVDRPGAKYILTDLIFPNASKVNGIANRIIFGLLDLFTLVFRIITWPHRYFTIQSAEKHPFFQTLQEKFPDVDLNSAQIKVGIFTKRKVGLLTTQEAKLAYDLHLSDSVQQATASNCYWYKLEQQLPPPNFSKFENTSPNQSSITSVDQAYQFMELKNPSPWEAISRKHKILVLQLHPDKFTDPTQKRNMTEMFQTFQKHYEVLKKAHGKI